MSRYFANKQERMRVIHRLRLMCAFVAAALVLVWQPAQANPMDATVVTGQASFATTGNTLTVVNTPGTIINWQSFSIGSAEITNFVQQSASSAVLNRVIGNDPSNILGTLESNGRVFLINPHGIAFGAGSLVDVAGLVASTLNISDADFQTGRYNFTEVPGVQNISNAGNITAQDSGQIYLIAPNVENSGVITAPNGEILLAAGSSVELVNSSDPNLRVSITAPAGDATNVGQLIASSGSLGLFGTVVKNSGTVSADSATMQGGRIVFRASERTEISGTVTANGTTGGEIKALGNEVGIMDGASITANGTQGGGTVLIGGDYQGANPDVQNAQITYVDANASISADATDTGDGGRIIVWSDNTTRAYGDFSVRGGANGGDGGFIETSGHYLDVAGIRIDTAALNGAAGAWLLDPWNVTITATADAGGTFVGGIWTPSATGSTITAATIVAALNAGTSVTVNTSGGGGAEAGNITVNAAISSAVAGTGTTLTLNADNNIAINQSITSTGNALNLVLNHGATGSVTLANALSLAGGNVDVQKAGVTGAGTLNVDGGTTTLTGTLAVTTLGMYVGSLNLNGPSPATITTLNMSGGTINDAAGMVLSGGLNWSGPNGTTITGAGILTTAAGSTSTISGTATLTTKTWNNAGTLTLSGTGSLWLGSSTVVNNETTGIINLSGTNTTPINRAAGTSTFNNAGTINKTTSTSQTFNTNVAFNNTGTVNVNAASGSLLIAGGGIDTGAYNIATGNTLNFSGGTRTLDAGSTVTGAGTLQVGGATVNANVALGIANTGTGITVSAGTLNANAGSLSGALVPVTVTFTGTLNLNSGAPLTLGNLTFSAGNLTSADALTVNNFAWSGGNYSGTGGLTTTGTSTISGAANMYGATWNQSGTLTISGSGQLNINTGSVLNNEATGIINLTGTSFGPISYSTGTIGASIFNNAGTVNKTTATGHTWHAYLTFNNTGTVNADSGTLIISSSGTDTGVYNIASGATLLLQGTRTLNAGANITGLGTLELNGTINVNVLLGITNTGTALVVKGGTLNANAGSLSGILIPITIGGGGASPIVNFNTGGTLYFSDLTLDNSGKLRGSDALNVSGTFTWSGGTYSGTGGLTTTGVSTVSSITGVASTLDAATWSQAGTLTISGAGYLNIINGATLNNEVAGTINLSGSSIDPFYCNLNCHIYSFFNNAGTLNKAAGSSATQTFVTAVTFSNTGTVNVDSGTLAIEGTLSQTGVINVASGATFSKTAGFTNTGILSGLGTIVVGTGAAGLINQGNINPGGTGAAGTLSITGDLQLSTGSILNMELGGTAAGQHDMLAVSGAVSGNTGSFGTLALTKINGYVVAIGDSYQLITAASGINSATFAPFALARANLTPTYNATNFTLGATPMVITVTADAISKIYGTTDPELTYVVSGFDTGDTAVDILSGALNRPAGENTGDYVITQGSLSAVDYTVIYVGNNLTITPVTLTYAATAASRIYGAADPAFMGDVTGFVAGDTLATATTGTLAYATSATATSGVGSYDITGSGLSANNGNYVFVQAAGNSTAMTITPAPLDVTADNALKVYGATQTYLGSEFTSTGLVNGETIGSVALTSAGDVATAAVPGSPYAITASGATGGTFNAANYTITYNSGSLTITPAALSITATDATKTYDTLAYSGGNGVTYNGFVNGENSADLGGALTYSGTSQGAVNAGSYAISAGGLTSGNYSINYVDGVLTVTPAAVTLMSIAANDASKTYGTTLTFSGTEFTPVGLLGGDVISSVTLTSAGAAATANAGTYAITPSNAVFSAGSVGNYDISYVDGLLTVNPAALTVTANAISKIYGDADPALSYTTSGLLFGDTLNGSLDRVSGENVGTYAIDQGTLNNANYAISYTGSNLSITPATLTIIADDVNKIMTAADPLLTYTVQGLKLTDTAASTVSGSLMREAGEAVGTYLIGNDPLSPLTVTSSNYLTTYAYVPGTFTILAASGVIGEIVEVSAQSVTLVPAEEESDMEEIVVMAEVDVTARDNAAPSLPVCN